MAFVDDFNISGKTKQELGQMLLEELARGYWGAQESRVDKLLAANASLEERDDKGNTALLVATSEGLTSMALKILSRNPDINAVNKRNETALILSLQAPSGLEERSDDDWLKIAKEILKKKPDVKPVSTIKENALLLAAGRGLKFYTQDIIALGPDFYQEDMWGNTALKRAKGNSNFGPTVELLEASIQAFEIQREEQRVQREFVERLAKISEQMRQGTAKAVVAPERAVFNRKPKPL